MTRTTKTAPQDAIHAAARRAVMVLCAIALACLPAATAQARLGDLDPGFDADGIALPAVGTTDGTGAQVEAITMRPDGRPIAAGWARNVGGLDEPLVLQLTGTGALDPDFGTSGPGVTRIPSSAPLTRLHGIALDANGNVLAAGDRRAATAAPTAPIALRLTEAGGSDTSFSGAIGGTGEARAVAPVVDGKMLVAGWRVLAVNGPDAFFVARLTVGGQLDTSGFSGDGIAVADFGSNAHAQAMAVGPDGKIVLAGWSVAPSTAGAPHQPAMARFNPDGTPDTSFGVGGLLGPVGADPDGFTLGEWRAVSVDALGRITAAGVAGRHVLVTRRLQLGQPDPSFGTDGRTYALIQERAGGSGLALDGDRTIVAGAAATGTTTQLMLGALDGAGEAEPGFGGWRTFASPLTGSAEALGASLGQGGTVYTAGVLVQPNGPRAPYVSRHLPNAAPSAALAGAAQALVGAPVSFDAGASTDPEGEPLRFAFDLDGNGSYELDGGGNPFVLRSFPAPGQYTVGVRVSDPRGASATAAVAVDVSAGRKVPQPLLSKQGVAKPLKGIVRFRLPGKKKFVRLVELTAIPNGTEIDARKGRVLLTVLHDASGRLDGAQFYSGRFTFRQGKGKHPITTLTLTGGSFKGCMRKSHAARSAVLAVASSLDKGGPSKRKVRKLWGDGRGRFRTRGKYGAATVRGTKWLTQDRCDGTLVRVVRGKVSVEDLVRRKRKDRLIKAGGQIFLPALKRQLPAVQK